MRVPNNQFHLRIAVLDLAAPTGVNTMRWEVLFRSGGAGQGSAPWGGSLLLKGGEMVILWALSENTLSMDLVDWLVK